MGNSSKDQKPKIWLTLFFFTAMQANLPLQGFAFMLPAQNFQPPQQPEQPFTPDAEEQNAETNTENTPASNPNTLDENPLSSPSTEESGEENSEPPGEEEPATVSTLQTQNSPEPFSNSENSTNVTTLPGQPILSTFSSDAEISIEQESSSSFRLNYDLTAPEAFGGAIINFGESPAGPQDLSGLDSFDFEFATSGQCSGRQCVKVEFVDVNDQIGIVFLEDLSSSFTGTTFTQAEIQASNPAIDFSQIKQINFVVDKELADPDTGTLDVRIGGLAFTPVVSGISPPEEPTALPGTPLITSFSNESDIAIDEDQEAGRFRMNYDVSAPESFAGGIINYGESTGPEDLSGIEAFLFNLSTDNMCENSKCLKIEFVDDSDNTSVVEVTGLAADPRTVRVTREMLLESNSALDLSNTRQINFVIEESNTDPKVGFAEVQTGGFGQAPAPSPEPVNGTEPAPDPGTEPEFQIVSAALPPGTPTTLPGSPPVTTFSDQSDIAVETVGDDTFRFTYDVSTPESFAGGIINYIETPEGAADLSGFETFDFNMLTNNTCSGSKCIKVEFVDTSGEMAVVEVHDLETASKLVSISAEILSASNAALNLTSIRQINFVVEEGNTEPKNGFLEVETSFENGEPAPAPSPEPSPEPSPDLEFPIITATLPPGTPTTLPGSPPITTFADESDIDVETTRDDTFRFTYDVSTPESFAGGIINYMETPEGAADLSGFETFDFNMLTNNTCLGSKCIKVEFVDTSGEMAAVEVHTLEEALKLVSIPAEILLTANANLNLSSIRQINFVVEEGNTEPKNGFLEVETSFENGEPAPAPSPEPEEAPAPAPEPEQVLEPVQEETPEPSEEPEKKLAAKKVIALAVAVKILLKLCFVPEKWSWIESELKTLCPELFAS